MKYLFFFLPAILILNACSRDDVYFEEFDEDIPSPVILTCDSMQVYTEVLDYPNENRVELSIFSVENGVPPYAYSWSNGASTALISVEQNDSYSFTVTDNIGCVFSDVITIDHLLDPCLGLSVQLQEISAGNIQATANGGQEPYSYSWSNGFSGPTLNVTYSGLFAVTVTDAMGCVVEESINVDLSDPCSSLEIQNYIWNPVDQELSINVIGGTPPYAYNWSTGAATQMIPAQAGNLYSVTATDANGCVVALDIQL